jgi:hypothetical protein
VDGWLGILGFSFFLKLRKNDVSEVGEAVSSTAELFSGVSELFSEVSDSATAFVVEEGCDEGAVMSDSAVEGFGGSDIEGLEDGFDIEGGSEECSEEASDDAGFDIEGDSDDAGSSGTFVASFASEGSETAKDAR